MFTDGTMWTWFKVLKWDMEAGKKSMQINDYKDKGLCQKWDKDGWLRWEAGQFLMNFIISEIPTQFLNVGVFHFRPHFPFANFQKRCIFQCSLHWFSHLSMGAHSLRSLSGRQRNTRSHMTYDVYLMSFEKCWNVHTEKYYTSFNAIQTKFFARSNIARYHFCWESAIASKFLPADLFHVISLLRGTLLQD